MKYVLMYTNRPDLDAAVPEERQAEVYQAIYGGSRSMAMSWPTAAPNCGAPETATTVKYGPNDGAPMVVDGPFS